MGKLKNILKLYVDSWKHSFNLKGKEKDGEFASFFLISGLLGIILTIIFISSYETSAFSINDGGIHTVNNYLGVALFWCYMSFAMFPFAGLVARRLNSYEIDISKVFSILNRPIKYILIACILASMIIGLVVAGNIFTGLEIMLPLTQILFFGAYIFSLYIGFVFFLILGYQLYSIYNLREYLERKKNKKSKVIIAIIIGGLILLVSSMMSGIRVRVIDILLIIAAMILVFKYFTQTTFLIILIAALFHNIIGFICSICVISAVVIVFFCKKINMNYLKLYAPIIFICFLLPFNLPNPSTGSWGTVINNLTGTNYVEQKVESIGDKQINSLAIPLLKTMSEEKPGKNLLISVHNIYQGLGLLANGAEGETAKKLKELLGQNDLSKINEKSKEIIAHHSTATKYNNKLYMTKKHLSQNFKNALNKYNIKLSAPKKECTINYESKIEFASVWKTKFGNHLRNEAFYTPHGVIRVPMMSDEREVYIAQGEGFRVLALPYKSGDNFYIILPDDVWKNNKRRYNPFDDEYDSSEEKQFQQSTTSLDEILQKLTPEALNLKFEQHKIELSIPVFELSQKISFKSALKALGMGNLFARGSSELNNILSAEADTTECARNNIFIEDIDQQNKIEVNEKGTVAISIQMITAGYATGIDIDAPFIIDRPFIFMINNGAFVGIINDPSAKE